MAEDTKTDEVEETEETDADDEEFEFAEDPTFDVSYKGDCAYEVGVTIPVANEAKQAEELFDELKDDAELPGFRRGRAPRKLIEKKFAKAVKGEVEGKLISAAFQKLIKDEDLKPLTFPDIDGLDEIKDRDGDTPIACTYKFEVSPRVELGKYRGIDVERPIVAIDDQDVEESIKETLERQAVFGELEGGVAAEGDQVIMDFEGKVKKEVFEGGSAENYPYILGSKRFFPEFEKALLGASPGDDLKCKVTFPDDYFAEDLRGKKANFTIKVNEVKRRNVPELTDDYAKELGAESAEDFSAKVREQLAESARERSKQITESRALQAVIDDSTFEIPKSVIERAAEDSKEQEIRRLMGMRIPMAAIEERMDEIEAQASESSLRNLKSLVTLNEIGEAEGLEVTDEDFEKEAEKMSQSLGLEAEMVAQYLAQSEDRNSYVDRIYRSKAVSVLIDNAKITDKELTREEMDQEEANEEQGED